jgi:predicted glycosyltransferase
MTLKKRALLVPRVQPGVEQCVRAERMAGMGLLRMLHPNDLAPATLMKALQAELGALARRETRPLLRRLDGLERVTAALFDAIGLPLHQARGTAAAHDAHRDNEWSRPTAAAASAC